MKKGWKPFSPAFPEGKEENGYPDADSNKTKINYI
jgi:hypothetical protein